MRVDVFTDLVCPYCWLGKRRLEAALAQRPGLDAEVRYWPFELNPAMPEAGLPREDYLAAKLGGLDALRAAQARLAESAAVDGLALRFDLARTSPNTRAAHALSLIAADAGRQAQVQEALFSAYFAEGRDIGDLDTLVEIAAGAGLEPGPTRARLQSRSDWAAVEGLEREGSALGIRAVPFFVFDGRIAVSGAQPPAALLAALERARPPATA